MYSSFESKECSDNHNAPTLLLSLALCIGMIISYLPQHIRIIRTKSSEGFSPWYLLLGATSSASGMLNLLIVQWSLFGCCKFLSAGRCFESLLGFFQVTLQWALFSIIMVLYLVYFPRHLKYQKVIPISSEDSSLVEPNYGATEHCGNHDHGQDKAKISTTPEWRLSVTLGVVVILHLGLLLFLSLTLLVYLPSKTPPHPLLSLLATFLGVSATILAVLQYAPQIQKTYQSKLVGALSLGTMAIQVPGSVLFVLSLVFRAGTNWTSWLAYAVTGVMQGALLIICLLWKERQKALGIDDFGNALHDRQGTEESQQGHLISS
ncbi:uncharacterized protein L203_103191 [Cryptococcus depauperatus CBS 7841]|uniref:PQ loop repeat protein n=1 Tax=Cryptococcus depauperatus CBS 7841 TaxID=1295531 RepID=A0AAJ8JT44_9TREE